MQEKEEEKEEKLVDGFGLLSFPLS